MRRSSWVLASLFALAGCAIGPSLQSRMAAYIGASTEQLVKGLGVPDKQVNINGEKYFAYDRSYTQVEPPMGGFYGPFYGPYAGPVFGPAFPATVDVYGCETTFLLKDGKVVSFTLRGNDCR
ncbi:MAG: hypothetical protein B7X08_04120 [Acidocella sp. 20-63-7]|nr:MAG: hypothetical protein B7X08_04120 [Acidocella sp. 20-63-7]HQT46599.1 hypothetical protein [Acidocella sp.]